MNAILALEIIVIVVAIPAAMFWGCRRVRSRYRWGLFVVLLTGWWGITILPAVLELPDLERRIEQAGAELLEQTNHRDASRSD